jgi:hypothetical protein
VLRDIRPARATLWSPVELRFDGPSDGNPFTDVDFTARLIHDSGAEMRVGGFYDGDGRWIIRFLPTLFGAWRFVTWSTDQSLRGLRGEVRVGAARGGDHGPVRADGFHFVHADGRRHAPLGTTAYAWIHQPAAVRDATLRTLRGGPFTKIRMSVFPKSYLYNSNEPALYPFDGDLAEGFDHTRFDPAFFRHLEQCVAQLGYAGIEADVILFHPYDRWGFAELGAEADDRYTRYLVRRLAAYPNVWWSMANEYDLMRSKSEEDWERLARVVAENDPVGHLCSIHNCRTHYDHTRDWVTHASVQRVDRYRTAENVTEWRQDWGKPVIVDECCYEGNIERPWGNISGQELTRRFWEGAIRGGYVGHGETYHREDEQLWWAKGGELVGESPARIAFLRRVIQDAPGGHLEPLDSGTAVPAAGVEGDYHLLYFGLDRPLFSTPKVPAGGYRVDVIDTWNMTIDTRADQFDGSAPVSLPGREFLALRLTRSGMRET